MYILTVEDHFASAHQLRGYKGKCENIHGHNWKVVLNVGGEKLNELGLLIDFHDLKAVLKKITGYLDHKNINEIEPFNRINPSSENIAEYIAIEVQKDISSINNELRVESVTVWESESSRCTFYPQRSFTMKEVH
jgi:6-pyruvoyltetrahydropterin/6-carboxytetrahydropterin synthase